MRSFSDREVSPSDHPEVTIVRLAWVLLLLYLDEDQAIDISKRFGTPS